MARLYNYKIKTLYNYLQGYLLYIKLISNYFILSLINKIILRDYILNIN